MGSPLHLCIQILMYKFAGISHFWLAYSDVLNMNPGSAKDKLRIMRVEYTRLMPVLEE